MIVNPILRGFNPDPSICRVGYDYYIATSTFEWYPGVQIHHSTDLANWRLVKRPLDRAIQLDMRGNPDSGGVWAPCLSWNNGLFWLVYTDMKRHDGNFKDSHNYIVTSPNIEGPWSDPIYVNSSGFDPSLFHDDDGRKWFLNLVWNHRSESVGGSPKHPAFAGILLQEYDAQGGRLVGKVTNITPGSKHGLTEAPHLYKRNGWYYLTVAEGGTGYQHAVTMMRSKSIKGPYDLHPDTHLLTAKENPNAPLKRVGHGQIVETPDGQVYHTYLCSRPLPGTRRSPLGRETGIQPCIWKEDGWLYSADGIQSPGLEVAPPNPESHTQDEGDQLYRFDGKSLPIDFQWLRTPFPDRLFKLTGQCLQLIGRESPGSWYEQSLVARRQCHHHVRAESKLKFQPENYQQLAGIIHYYNRHKFHFFGITWHEELGRVLTVLSCPGEWPDGKLEFTLEDPIAIPAEGNVRLAATISGDSLSFSYSLDSGETWSELGSTLDASVISDEGGRGEHASFTGAFLGMAAFDTSGGGKTADFYEFRYRPGIQN